MKNKNTKNWYTIDALGANFAIFGNSDNFDTFDLLTNFKITKVLWDLRYALRRDLKIPRDLKMLRDLKNILLTLLTMLAP